jgi:methylphosphotriester-DNA--protein-cysteine methyltransferase
MDLESATPPTLISLFDDDDSRWQALETRNANADGFFVYAVKSTKIYCRPTCKARLARRANVSFYDTGEQAVQAGFRACKRCKPEVGGFMPEEAAVGKIRAFVLRQQGQGEPGAEAGAAAAAATSGALSLSQMAKQSGLSKWHFHRVFKKCVGVTPVEFARMRQRSLVAGGGSAGSVSTESSGAATPGPGTEPDLLQQHVDFGDLGLLDMSAIDESTLTGSGGFHLPDLALLPEPADQDDPWGELLSYPEEPLT